MHEPGAPIGLGFACASEVETLGGGLYRVYFGVYGAGEIIDDDDVYDLLPEQAALFILLLIDVQAVVPVDRADQRGLDAADTLPGEVALLRIG